MSAQGKLQAWLLCERWQFPDGTMAHWQVCYFMAPADHRACLQSFEQEAGGVDVPERKALLFTAEVP